MNSSIVLWIIGLVLIFWIFTRNSCSCIDNFSHSEMSLSAQLRGIANPEISCSDCLQRCHKIPSFKNKSVATKDCSLKCFAQCAAKEGKDCVTTCTQSGKYNSLTEKDCKTACGDNADLGCRWNCKKQGLGDYCRRDCPAYS